MTKTHLCLNRFLHWRLISFRLVHLLPCFICSGLATSVSVHFKKFCQIEPRFLKDLYLQWNQIWMWVKWNVRKIIKRVRRTEKIKYTNLANINIVERIDTMANFFDILRDGVRNQFVNHFFHVIGWHFLRNYIHHFLTDGFYLKYSN